MLFNNQPIILSLKPTKQEQINDIRELAREQYKKRMQLPIKQRIKRPAHRLNPFDRSKYPEQYIQFKAFYLQAANSR